MQTALTLQVLNLLYGNCLTCGLGQGHGPVINSDCDCKCDRSHGHGSAIPALAEYTN